MLLPISLLKYLLFQKLLLDGGRTMETFLVTKKLKNESFESSSSSPPSESANETSLTNVTSSSSSSSFLLACFTTPTTPTSTTSTYQNSTTSIFKSQPPTSHQPVFTNSSSSSTVRKDYRPVLSSRQIMPPVASLITINTIVTAVNLILIALIIIIEVAIAIIIPVIVGIIIIVVLRIVIPIIIGIIRGIIGMIPFVKKAIFRNVLNGQLGQNLKRALSKVQRWLRALGLKRERLLLQQLLSQHPDDWWHFVGTAWPDAQLDLAGQKLDGINRELDIIRRYLEFSKIRYYEEAKKQRKEYAKIKQERICLLKTGFKTLNC